MSSIQPVNHLSLIQPAAGGRPAEAELGAKPSAEDRIDLSGSAQLFQQTEAADATGRSNRLSQIKQALNSGTYEPNLQIVAERLLTDVGLGAA